MASRPSLTFSRTRAAAAKAAEEDVSSLSTAMTYRRRFPKLGSQFQAKVPKKTSIVQPYETKRPVPVRMSSQISHMIEEEASEYISQKPCSGKWIPHSKCRNQSHECVFKRLDVLVVDEESVPSDGGAF